MFSIDRKIGIKRQHCVLLMNFGHSDDTRIGQRHRSVTILLMQFTKGDDMFINIECYFERTIFKQSEQCILRPSKTGQ